MREINRLQYPELGAHVKTNQNLLTLLLTDWPYWYHMLSLIEEKWQLKVQFLILCFDFWCDTNCSISYQTKLMHLVSFLTNKRSSDTSTVCPHCTCSNVDMHIVVSLYMYVTAAPDECIISIQYFYWFTPYTCVMAASV